MSELPQYLITYDLAAGQPSPHRPVLDAAEREDLLYVYMGGTGRLLRLPNTTLWGNFPNAQAATDAFNRAVGAAEEEVGRSINVEKRVTTRLTEALFNSDVRKEPEARWTEETNFETSRTHQLADAFFSSAH